jgi:ribonuclease P protein component
MPQDGKYVGFTASKKVGGAVKRNRAKRRLRALFIKYNDILKNGTFVFVAKNLIVDVEFLLLEKSFLYSLKKLNAIK